MSVSLSPNINFTSYRLPDSVVEKAKEQAKAENNTLAMNILNQCRFEADKSSSDEKQKKEPGKLRKAIASVAKFFTATEEITKGTAKGAVYGTMTGAGWAVDPAWKMTYDADAKTYTLTKEFTEGDRFGIRICVGNTTDQRSWANASNVSGSPAGFDISGSDISCTVTGTYTVVVDMSGETPVVTITAATAAE